VRASGFVAQPISEGASFSDFDVTDLIAIHEKRNKNMRPQYLVSWARQKEQSWVFEKDLLPKWRQKIREFNEGTPASSQSSAAVSSPLKPHDTPLVETPLAAATQAECKLGELPPFNAMSSPVFKWGTKDAPDFIHDVERAYATTTKWRKNVFKLPSGQSGKLFTQGLSRLFAAYGERSPLEVIALKAAAIMAPLLLQQPLGKPTYRDYVNHLGRRLQLWEDGISRNFFVKVPLFRRN
jgi:hypothetical protein